MVGITSIQVQESLDNLAERLRQAEAPTAKERLQVLYWLKQDNAPSISTLAQAIGKHRSTVQTWLCRYREGGIESMLGVGQSLGGVRVIPQWAEDALAQRLEQEGEGFGSYGEVQQWLFKAFWLYGAVEPATGESFFLQFSHVDTECYQRFLDEFSKAYPDSLNILQVDNGRFHTSKNLVVPENVILLFQPPYCPELNPIEWLWEHLKADLKRASFKTLEQLQTKVDQLLAELSSEVIASITGYSFILEALSVVNTV